MNLKWVWPWSGDDVQL